MRLPYDVPDVGEDEYDIVGLGLSGEIGDDTAPHYYRRGMAPYQNPTLRMTPSVLPYGRLPVQSGGGFLGGLASIFGRLAKFIIPGVRAAAKSKTLKSVAKHATKALASKKTKKAAVKIGKQLGVAGAKAIAAGITGKPKKAEQILKKQLGKSAVAADSSLRHSIHQFIKGVKHDTEEKGKAKGPRSKEGRRSARARQAAAARPSSVGKRVYFEAPRTKGTKKRHARSSTPANPVKRRRDFLSDSE